MQDQDIPLLRNRASHDDVQWLKVTRLFLVRVVLALFCVYLSLNAAVPSFPGRFQRRWTQYIVRGRGLIAAELSNYSSPAAEWQRLVPEAGGRPRRALLVAAPQAGSSLVRDALLLHPALMLHYEPLKVLHPSRRLAITDGQADRLLPLLVALFNCDFSTEYVATLRRHQSRLAARNRLLAQLLQTCDDTMYSQCWSSEFFAAFCRLAPYQAMVTLHLPLQHVRRLMRAVPNLRVAVLVRDPRATLELRRSLRLCRGYTKCPSYQLHCRRMERDYWQAGNLTETFSARRFRVFRYEDLWLRTGVVLPRMLAHLGLLQPRGLHQLLSSWGDFLDDDRDHKRKKHLTSPYQWSRYISWDVLNSTQVPCRKAMQMWGYTELQRHQLEEMHQLGKRAHDKSRNNTSWDKFDAMFLSNYSLNRESFEMNET